MDGPRSIERQVVREELKLLHEDGSTVVRAFTSQARGAPALVSQWQRQRQSPFHLAHRVSRWSGRAVIIFKREGCGTELPRTCRRPLDVRAARLLLLHYWGRDELCPIRIGTNKIGR
uniref:Uncharacterized protein n=1 Tax=Oryza sativa subsp. japonica TaxID=39947 RepID=Q5Z5E2_ORYSJ|nr:hypothetical protein [Oryza sativa Japonica Group]BAD54627.1 hypothetical protein [Oryza sativa Japonica Group]